MNTCQLSTPCERVKLLVGTLHSADCLKMLMLEQKKPEALLQKIDFLEARLDLLPTIVLPSSWPVPIIATARHPAEGGGGNLSLSKRRALLEKALPWVSAIDVELRSVKQFTAILAAAKKEKRRIILSFHDFKGVPTLTHLEKLAERAHDCGADFFKVACTPRSDEELMRLVIFQSRSKWPTATMGMGTLGKISRLLLATAGSALVYGWLYKPHVVGQWSIQEWLQFLPTMAARTGVEPVRQP